VRVNSAHLNLTNIEQRQATAETQTKSKDLAESVSKLLSSTPTIAIEYYLSRKLTLILRFHGGEKAEQI